MDHHPGIELDFSFHLLEGALITEGQGHAIYWQDLHPGLYGAGLKDLS